MLQHGVGREQGQEVANLLQSFIGPLERWLDRQIDQRLVRTFFLALVAIVRLRHSRSGLLLSELGAHVLSPAQAPAGTKRLSNLLRSPKWSHPLLEKFLWYRADQSLTQLEEQGEGALAIWTRVCWRSRRASPWRGYVRCVPAKSPGLSASNQAFTIHREGRRYSSLDCSGSPSWWRGCRDRLPWPLCAGGPAGVGWPVTGGANALRCSPTAPSGGSNG